MIQQLFILIEGRIERVLVETFALKSDHTARSRLYMAPGELLSCKSVSSVIPVLVLDLRKKQTWHDLVHFKAKVVFKPEDFNLYGEQSPLSLC